jgi:large subunit ribosomal protein L22
MATTTTDDRMTVRAQAKWVRMSARKARLVLDHIRGRTVPEARTILAFTQRAAAIEIEKVLRSAVANAEANHGLDGDELIVEAAYADEGPTLKRWKPRARGRATRIRRRTCHVTVVLVEPEAPTRPRRRQRAAAAEARTPDVEAAADTTEATEGTTQAETKPKRRSPAKKPAKKKEAVA